MDTKDKKEIMEQMKRRISVYKDAVSREATDKAAGKKEG